MGIRFHCPNGHKLNVKAFLAGKKGVCPDCGVKLRIPDRSEPGLDSGIDEEKQEEVKPAPVIAVSKSAPAMAAPAMVMTSPAQPAYSQPQPAPAPAFVPPGAARPSGIATPVMPAAGYPVMSAPPPMPVSMPAPAPYAAPGAPMPGRGPMPPSPPVQPLPPPPGTVDPITENPLATWFVRPPSGGQFGPARGEVMRKWLTEGRVTADSLVWREGWIDWLSATEVFPQLGKNAPAAPGMFGIATATVKPVTSGSSQPAARKPASGNVGVMILIGLAVICVLLVGVLAVVLSGAFKGT